MLLASVMWLIKCGSTLDPEMGRDEMGRDEMGRDEMGRDGTRWDEMG